MSLKSLINKQTDPDKCWEYLSYSKYLFLQIFENASPDISVYRTYKKLGGWFAVAAPHIRKIKLEPFLIIAERIRNYDEIRNDSQKLWIVWLNKIKQRLEVGVFFEMAITQLIVEKTSTMPQTLKELKELTQLGVSLNGTRPSWSLKLKELRQIQKLKLQQLQTLRGDTVMSLTMTTAALISSRGLVPQNQDWEKGMLYAKLFEAAFLLAERKADKIIAIDKVRRNRATSQEARGTISQPLKRESSLSRKDKKTKELSKPKKEKVEPSRVKSDVLPSDGEKTRIPGSHTRPIRRIRAPEIILKTQYTGEYRELDTRTAGKGGIRRIMAFIKTTPRERGERVVKIEGFILSAISQRLPFRSLRRASKIKGLPSDYQRLHLWGPGFGDEAAAGIMYGPRELNLSIQSRIESTLRDLHTKREKVYLTATATSYKKDPRIRLSNTNELVLKSLEYKIEVISQGSKKHVFSVFVDVSTPGSGGKLDIKVERGSSYQILDDS